MKLDGKKNAGNSIKLEITKYKAKGQSDNNLVKTKARKNPRGKTTVSNDKIRDLTCNHVSDESFTDNSKGSDASVHSKELEALDCVESLQFNRRFVRNQANPRCQLKL